MEDSITSNYDKKRIEKRFRLQKIEQQNIRSWMKSHGKISEVGLKQRHDLKSLFSQLDSDNSGVISIEELYNPLLSLGVVHNKSEVENLVQYISSKKAGVIQFDEFIKIFEFSEKKNLRKKAGELENLAKTVAGNMKALQKNELPLSIAVCNRRRELMMKAYVSENLGDKEKGIKVINAFANEKNSSSSPSKGERIFNRRVSEFGARISERPKEMKVFQDSFIKYLPPTRGRIKHLSKDERINFINEINNAGL